MDLGIAGKKAVVAASSSGLGLGAAKALAVDGVQVAVSGRSAEKLAAAKAEVDAASGRDDTIIIAGDYASAEGGGALVAAAIEALGQVDILVTNAGGPPPGTFASTDQAGYEQAVNMNLLAMIEMCRVAIPPMRERGWGRVCAITSIGVKMPIGNLMASSVARAGLTSFLKITAREVAADGVTVNSCQPGLHWTERVSKMTDRESASASVPTGVIGEADDFGQAVAFLCSEQAKFINGTGLLVDGGAAPGLLD